MKKYNGKALAGNLVRNWYFPLGAAAFYCAVVQWYYAGSFIPPGLGLAFLLCVVYAAMSSSFAERIHAMRWQVKALAAMTALGVFWDPAVIPLGGLSFADESVYLNSLVERFRLPAVVGDLAVAAAWVFVFVCIAMLFDKLLKIILDNGVFEGIAWWECAVYGVLAAVFAFVILIAYSRSGAFYGEGTPGAVIYSTDSNLIVPMGAYVNLYHPENDIRQPLFMVFAAPLTGLFYFLGAWLHRWPTAQIALLGGSQMILIFLGGFLLARALKLSPGKRVCFLLLFSCSYMYILFTLVMEQYAVAFFWLMLSVYLISQGRSESVAVLGAGGTLITSLALVPFAQNADIRKDFWGWFRGCARQGVAYVLMVFAFCRLDVLLKLTERSEVLVTFTGKEITGWDRLLQYFTFIRSCFLAPDTYVNPTGEGGPARWQQLVTDVNFLGIGLLTLVVVSLWLNRKKRSSLLCGYWVAFSVVVLAVIGWGTAENGLMLYGIYFGWAYFALLFQLVQQVAEKLRKPWLLPVCTVIGAGAMLSVNIPDLVDMIAFAQTYYPR